MEAKGWSQGQYWAPDSAREKEFERPSLHAIERDLSIALLLLKDLPFQIMTSDKPVGQLHELYFVVVGWKPCMSKTVCFVFIILKMI